MAIRIKAALASAFFACSWTACALRPSQLRGAPVVPQNTSRDASSGYFTFDKPGEEGYLENQMLSHVQDAHCEKHSGDAAVDCVLKATDEFCWQQQWMMLVGDEKGTILDAELRNQLVVTHDILARQQVDRPIVVLELGTYVGYSTTRLARLMPEGSTLYTVEFRDWRQDIAKRFVQLSSANLKPNIEFMLNKAADAIDILGERGVTVDFVFMDHYEQDYFNSLNHLVESGIMHEGSILVADNIGVNLKLKQVQHYITHVGRSPWVSYSTEHVPNEYTAEEDAIPDSMVISKFSKDHYRELARKTGRKPKAGFNTFTIDGSVERSLVDFLHTKKCPEQADPARCVLAGTDTFSWHQHWLMLIGDEKGPILDKLMRQKVADFQREAAHGLRDGKPFVAIELGTYIGYSTTRLARMMPPGSKLYTVEFQEMRQGIAKQVVDMARPLPADIEFMLGAATDMLGELGNRGVKADFVFVDHYEDDYYRTLSKLESKGLLHQGSMVIADNIGVNLNNSHVVAYLSHARGSGKYRSFSVEGVSNEYTAGEEAVPDSMEVSTWVAETECSSVGQSCSATRCCSTPKTQCYEKDAAWAACLEQCSHDDRGHGPWSCTQLAHMIPENAKQEGVVLVPGK